jgi:hypothetical protein
MVIEIPNGVDVSKLRLTEVLYSPEVGYTLVSIGRLDELGYSATFADGKCTLRDSAKEIVGQIPRTSKGLYRVVHDASSGSIHAALEMVMVMELHRRMGHIAPSAARRLAENGLVSSIKVDLSSGEPTFCESCVYAKATQKPIRKTCEGDQATEFAEEIHTDLWGPAPVATLGGRRYYISFTDDKTQLTYLHLLRQKSDAFDTYKQFEAWCSTQHSAQVKTLHSDRGGEYLGKAFTMHLQAAGTKQKLTVHDTPQHNGVTERLNCTLMEKVRAMLHDSGLQRTLWGEAVKHAVWLKNRTPTKALDGGTPLEATTGKKPNLSRTRPWGSKVWVCTENGDKLRGRVEEGQWVGIDEASENRCRVFWPGGCRITVERNIYWNATDIASFPREGEEDLIPNAMITTQIDSPPTQTSIATSSKTSPAPQAPRPQPPSKNPTLPNSPVLDMVAKRIRKPSQRVLDILNGPGTLPKGIQLPSTLPQVVIENDVALEVEHAAEKLMALLEDNDPAELALSLVQFTADAEALEPTSLAEAKRRPDWAQWEAGILEELATLQTAGTWELTELPAGANLVGSKWVF